MDQSASLPKEGARDGLHAGFARAEITPDGPIRMEGMLRAHDSTGVHDPLYAKALVLSEGGGSEAACALVALDVCAVSAAFSRAAREAASQRTGIPVDRILVAAKHNHSGPATREPRSDREAAYVESLLKKIVDVADQAARARVPAAIGWASGREETISHYRRLLADDGHVAMNWEPWPAERIVRPLGSIDPEVGVLKVAAAATPGRILGLVFNHAGHPNVMSGDNYLISPDYPGRAETILEQRFGGTAVFVNGAQGSVDIDGLRDRDWAGVERVGGALAASVAETAAGIAARRGTRLRFGACRYTLPARRISDEEKAWAEAVVKQTGGAVKPVADGVGDDYKANLFLALRKAQDRPVDLEQIAVALGDCALLSFPGELFTEVGQQIKMHSPFRHTFILGLTNGCVGYVPTRQAIREGGYEPLTRKLDDCAAELVVEQSLALLRRMAEPA